MRKLFLFASCFALFVAIGWADGWDKKTILTINESIQVPGAVLQPGTYVLKLVDSAADRHIVQITNRNEDEVITTILAIPNYRLKRTGKSEFQFWETPAGNARALRAWFYPGDNFGQEFAYPKGMSTKIAQYAETPVPTTPATNQVEFPTAAVTSVAKLGTEKPLNIQTYTPPREPTLMAAAAPPPPEPAPAPAQEKQLPKTASPLPGIALAACVAVAAGLIIRFTTAG